MRTIFNKRTTKTQKKKKQNRKEEANEAKTHFLKDPSAYYF